MARAASKVMGKAKGGKKAKAKAKKTKAAKPRVKKPAAVEAPQQKVSNDVIPTDEVLTTEATSGPIAGVGNNFGSQAAA